MPEGCCPARLIYLDVQFDSAILLVRHKVHEAPVLPGTIEGVSSEERERKDDAVRQRIVDTLPRYIPTLRCLTVSRRIKIRPVGVVERTWTCYRVTKDREVVEIPTWEGDRVKDYCYGAVDGDAFDRFDGE